MKIVQVSPYFYPHVGGVESHVMDISKELIKRGHEVTVLTSNFAGLKEEEEIFGVKVVRLKPLTILLRAPITPKIKNYLAKEEVDLVHSHSPPPWCSYFSAKACKRKALPFLVTYHCDVEIPSIFGLMVTELFRRSFGAYTMRQADKIIVTTRTYAATSRAIWRYLPEVIPNAVDTKIFIPQRNGHKIRERYGIKEEERIVLFVGRIVRHKGIEYLIESAKLFQGAKLMIVGEGDKLKSMKDRARSLRLEEKVIFTGKVPHSLLPSYYASCDLFVLPSISRLEAFGIVALEAMATGKPVVVSDIPGVREVITDGEEGLLCEPMNPKDLAQKIGRLLSDEELRRRMGEKGRRRVEENFSMEKVVDKIEKLYETVLQSKTSNL